MSYAELTALQYGRSKSFADAQTEAMAAYCQAEHDLKQLQAENAKLRELVRDLYECVSHANEQDWFYFERNMLGCGMCCTVNGEGCGLSVLADRMRELEVDA